MQIAALFVRQPVAALALAAVLPGALRVAVAAPVLVAVLVGALPLGLQDYAGPPPIAGLGLR